MALTLFSVTPSEACVERAFSHLGLIDSNVRNKLSPENVDALMFVRMNWPGRKPGARKSLTSLLHPPSEPEEDENADPEPAVAENNQRQSPTVKPVRAAPRSEPTATTSSSGWFSEELDRE